jgi:23S rRNA (uracil1939-C5)-methyltransferase
VVLAETAAFLRHAKGTPGLVVVDPPRAGLGREVTTLMGKVRARNVTYVSCDPATLSRDVAALLESGYRLAKMHLVDLFPQTFHLESVAQLTLE